jgi:hypothetical protein
VRDILLAAEFTVSVRRKRGIGMRKKGRAERGQ